MKLEYDPKHDVMNIEFIGDAVIDESVELDGIIIDYTKDKEVASVEILVLKKRSKGDPFETINFVLMKDSAEV